jgi:hypothetical protein
MFQSRASGVAVLLLLAGRALAQDAGPIDRVQLGDNDLDCVQIAAQVAQLDAILAPHSGDQGAVRGATESATRSRTGEVVAGVAKVLPFGGIFGDIAKDVLGRRGREAEARLAAARARKEYLVDMFLKRGCRVADVAAAGVKPQAPPIAAPDAKPAAEISSAGSEPAGATPGADVQKADPNAPAAGPQTAPDSPRAAPSASESSQQADQAGPEPQTPAAKPQPDGSREAEPATHQAPPRGPLFMLDFRLAFRTSADADGASGAPGLELGGVTLKTMQAITDTAYVALLNDLGQAGFEVLNPELAAPLPTGGSLPAPARAGDYLYFAPSGAPLAQAPAAAVPGSDAALAETRAALARAVAGRRPGVSYGIAVWYVDFARVSGAAGDQPRQLETRLAVAAGSHLALVEPAAGDGTPPDAVRVMNLGRDLVSREPYGQVRLSGPAGALELKADPQRFRSLIERQLKRGRSALISSLPPVPAAASDLESHKTAE